MNLSQQCLLSLLFICNLPLSVLARSSSEVDYSMYGMSMQRNWLYESRTVSIKLLGCVWGYVDADNGENLGCRANDSGDGTTSWYQMANCRRAQVAYGMYASTGSTSCNKRDLKESVSTSIHYLSLIAFALCSCFHYS